MPRTSTPLLKQFSPIRPWFRKVTPSTVRDDAIAGFTNAAIVLPQGVAFAVIAGLPPQYGLFTAMITPIIAAIWGSSMVMISGPTTAISAVLFASLVELAPPATPLYVSYALTMTLLVGMFQFAAGLARLGALITFVSHSVMIGFTAAAAMLIAASQVAPALGIIVERGGSVFERLTRVVENIGHVSWTAVAISGVTLLVLILGQRLDKRIPIYLIALAAGSVLGIALDVENQGISMFEPLGSIVPAFVLPTNSVETIIGLLPSAATIAFVGLLEAISIGRAFAIRREEKYEANQEIIGQGLSNMVGSFFQAYAGSGSFTRSGLNADAGARTPISALFAAGFLLILLFFVSGFVTYVPVPAMAGIIIYVAYRLVKVEEITHIIENSGEELIIMLATFFTGVIISLDIAILVGVIGSLFLFLRRMANPTITELTPAMYRGSRTFRSVDAFKLRQCPQISIVRITGEFFFGSVEHVEQELRRIDEDHPGHNIKIIILSRLGSIDLAAADLLIHETRLARAKGGDVYLVAVRPELIARLHRMHVVEELGEDNLFDSKAKALSLAVEQANNDRCAGCTVRAFQECAGKSCPDDHPQCYDQIVANPRDPKSLKPKSGLQLFKGFKR